MPTTAVLDELLIILAAACAVVPAFHHLRLSPVLGYLVAGMMIGPHGLGIVADVPTVTALAHFGIVFLLFAIGLELSVGRLRSMGAAGFGLGTFQVLATGVVLFAAARLCGLGAEAAAIVGGGIAMSSTALVLQDLTARGELMTRHGRAQLTILLLQDLAVVPLLALVPLLASGEPALAAALGLALLKAGAALVAIMALGRLILRPILHLIAAQHLPELFTGVNLLAVLGVGWLTEQAGLSMALGGFLAGLVLAETAFRHQIEADIAPFRGILLALFFMSVGMEIDLGLVADHAAALLVLVPGVIAVKTTILFGAARAAGHPTGLALQIGLSLSQVGEFAFVLFGLAVESAVLHRAEGQLALAVAALSMATTPLLTAVGRRLHHRLTPPSATEAARLALEGEGYSNHVVIAGFGRVGQTVARMLQASRIPYVALDLEPNRVHEGRTRAFAVYYGDASQPEILRLAGAGRARAAVITLDHPGAAERTVSGLRRHWPELMILVRARDGLQVTRLIEAGATVVVPEMVEGSLHLGAALLDAIGLPNDRVARLLRHFRNEAYARLGDLIVGTAAERKPAPPEVESADRAEPPAA